MRILVTKPTTASPDGIQVREYEAGQEYNLPPVLGKVFITEGWGEEVNDVEQKPENKAIQAPENKALGKPSTKATKAKSNGGKPSAS